MAIIHTATRAYAFQCSYNSVQWLDDPSTLLAAIQTALSGISNFSYLRLILTNVKDASGKKIELEIDGITYLTKTKLNATETDNLISALETAFNGVSNFTYSYINVVHDTFREDPTTGWPGQSMEEP